MRTTPLGRGAALVAGAAVLLATCAATPLADAGLTATAGTPRRSANSSSAASTRVASPSTATPSTASPRIVGAGTPRTGCAVAVSSWAVARLAAATVTVPVVDTDPGAVAALVAAGAGGVLLFGNDPPADLGSRLAGMRAAAPAGGIPPLIMTDEEGGGIQRLANLVGYLPWPRQLGAADTPAQIEAVVTPVAQRLAALGVTMDLAPVADLSAGPGPDATHPDGARSFSVNPAIAGPDAIAFAAGLAAGGVIPVLKHFPGLGTATTNTDTAPATLAPLARLDRADLLPFAAAIRAGIPAIMTSNATIPGAGRAPVSLSVTDTTGILRHQLGFTGLVITDSLSAGAITALGLGVAPAAVRAITAGADEVLYGPLPPVAAAVTFRQTVAALVGAVATGVLPISRLRAAVAHLATVEHLASC